MSSGSVVAQNRNLSIFLLFMIMTPIMLINYIPVYYWVILLFVWAFAIYSSLNDLEQDYLTPDVKTINKYTIPF